MNGEHAGKLVSLTATKEPQPGTVAHVPSWVLGQGVMGSTGTTYRFEFNSDPSILARAWDGTTTVFSIDTSGAVIIRPGGTNSVGLVIDNTIASSNFMTEWKNNLGNVVALVDNGGTFIASGGSGVNGFYVYTANIPTGSDKAEAQLIGGATPSLGFGPGSTTAVDTNLYRNAANVLKTDDQFRAVDGVQTIYISGAGKTAAADGDFTVAPTNGMTAVVFNTTDSTTRFSVRANGTWHTTAAL